LKYAYLGVIFVLIVVAAVSGCASGPAATPVPGGTPAGNPTAAPTAVPGMARSGSLFDMGRLQWFEYRVTTMTGEGKPSVSDIRFDYTTAVVGGHVVKDDRMTMKMAEPDMVMTMDSYYDPVTDKQIGGHMKMVSNDITVSDQDVAAANDQYRSSDIAGTFAASDWPLAGLGTEAVNIDGKAYSCTKYSVGNAGEYGTAWMSQGVPVPVKIESKSESGTSTWELIGWG
jgi:hypothetical protein